MANKVKIKLKDGKSKIKLKHGDGPLLVDDEQLRNLLGAALIPVLKAAPAPRGLEALTSSTKKLRSGLD